jgi:hypothetical protein
MAAWYKKQTSVGVCWGPEWPGYSLLGILGRKGNVSKYVGVVDLSI